MSSILKVNTIQDLDGNLIISKDSGGSGFLSFVLPDAFLFVAFVSAVSKLDCKVAKPFVQSLSLGFDLLSSCIIRFA